MSDLLGAALAPAHEVLGRIALQSDLPKTTELRHSQDLMRDEDEYFPCISSAGFLCIDRLLRLKLPKPCPIVRDGALNFQEAICRVE